MQFDLADRDWHEIWNASEENIQDKLPVDGFGTTREQQEALAAADWIQIYLAVDDKLAALKCGLYGRGREIREWREHMTEILCTLAPIREQFIGGAPCRKSN